MDGQVRYSVEADEDDQPPICLSEPDLAAVLPAGTPPRWVYIPTRRVIRLPYRRLSGHCGSSFGTFSRVCAKVTPTPSTALTRGQTSLPSGLSVVCGRGKAPSNISGTLVALAAHNKMSVPLELSDLSRNQLWRQIRGFSRSPLGKASTKGKLRSDPSMPAHCHKLAVFPHKVVVGNSGQWTEGRR